MAIAQEWLGDQGTLIMSASGVPIPLRDYGAVTFGTFEDDGSTILTLTQHTTNAAGSPDVESNLAVITRVHKGPGVGGGWQLVTQAAANTYDLSDDTTNDAVLLTVRADQLSDNNDWVELTVDGGICVAILHSPTERVAGASVRSSIAL